MNIASLKPSSSYSGQVEKEIKLLSFQDSDTLPIQQFNPHQASPFGSFTLRIQKYPGDVDLHEPFVLEEHSTENYRANAAKILAKRLQQKVRQILSASTQAQPQVISEIKAGVDPSYAPLSADATASMTEEELEERRNKYVIRWTVDQVLQGYRTVNGKRVTLDEALQQRGHIKIDVITIINGLFTEVTNFIFFGVIIDQDLHTINTSVDFTNREQVLVQYQKQLKEEIKKLFYSSLFYNPFKGVKRMFALSRANSADPRYERMMYELTPLVSGDISQLYQIKSSLNTYLLFKQQLDAGIYSVYKVLGRDSDRWYSAFLDRIKNLLSNNTLISDVELDMLNDELDTGVDANIEAVSDFLKERIANSTTNELKRIGFLPIPQLFLPVD